MLPHAFSFTLDVFLGDSRKWGRNGKAKYIHLARFLEAHESTSANCTEDTSGNSTKQVLTFACTDEKESVGLRQGRRGTGVYNANGTDPGWTES